MKSKRGIVGVRCGSAGLALALLVLSDYSYGADSDPVLRGEWPARARGPARTVAVSSNFAYVAYDTAVGARLEVLDLTDPAHPRSLGAYDAISAWITGIAVSGGYAYVSGGREEGGPIRDALLVLDVSDPAQPRRVGGCDSSLVEGHMFGVTLSGGFAYVLCGSGMVVLDISTPSRPQRVGAYSAGAKALAVSGGYAYVGLGWYQGPEIWWGLRVLDTSTPSNPRVVGGCDGQGEMLGVAVSGAYAYVTDGSHLRVVSIANPAAPQPVGSVITGGGRSGAVISGDFAYVPGGIRGLRVLDISSPANPQEVSKCDPAGYSEVVTVSGHFAYVAEGHAGLQVIDISDPLSPQRVGSYDTDGNTGSIAMSGRYVFLADGWAGLQVMDVSNLSRPERVGRYAWPLRFAGNIAVVGERAYVTVYGDVSMGGYPSAGSLEVMDVSNPSGPRRLGGWEFGKPIYRVAVSGELAFVAALRDGLQVIRVSDPENCQCVGGLSTGGYADDLVVLGDFAYVADTWTGLVVIDISQPTNPRRVGGYGGSGGIDRVAGWGNTLLIDDGSGGLAVLDVSDPANPKPVGSGSFSPGCWAMAGRFAYTAWPDRVHVIDFADPASPQDVGGCWLPQAVDPSASAIICVQGDLLVGRGSAGLALLEMEPRFSRFVRSGGELTLAWEAFGAPVVLQRSPSLTTPDWQTVAGSDTNETVALPTSGHSQEFFRLVKP